MKKYIILASISLILTLSSCEKLFMEKDEEITNENIFKEYATLVKEKYAMLDFKSVDINFLTDSILNHVNENLSEKELFDMLSIITERLRDGHSSLGMDEVNFYSYDFYSEFPPAFHFEILFNNYLKKDIAPDIQYIEDDEGNLKVVFGVLPQSNSIGYMWIPSWNIEMTNEEIEKIYKSVNETEGLIIDIRQNTGGDPGLAVRFASYLTDKTVYTGFERFKTGPATGDFADNHIDLIPTTSELKYLKSVAVITDRLCYSASTTFTYSTNPLDNVFFIGQRTGGGSGGVADGYLMNGWMWSLSTSEFIDHLGNHLDDGFDPDIKVDLDTLDKSKDEIIERAILELKTKF